MKSHSSNKRIAFLSVTSATNILGWVCTALESNQQYTRDGKRFELEHFAVKLQHQGRRDNFNLGTPNRTAAAVKARDIYVWGNIIYGPGIGPYVGNYIEFGPDGDFIGLSLSEDNLRPMKKAQIKGLRHYGGLTKYTFEETPLLTALRRLASSRWLEKKPEEMRRLFESAHPEIIQALSEIMTAESKGEFESKLDKNILRCRPLKTLF